MPHIILFEHWHFHGKHQHVFREEGDLEADDDFMDRQTSSMVILEGNWQFFRDRSFFQPLADGKILGPGLYPDIRDPSALGPGTNDSIRSLAGKVRCNMWREIELGRGDCKL